MLSVSHVLLVLIVILVVFGAGKLPTVLGDLGRGLRQFRKGLKGEEGSSEKNISKADDE